MATNKEEKKAITRPTFTEEQLDEIAQEILNKIITNINIRSGFGSAYRMIDHPERVEMLDHWKLLIKTVLK